MLSPSKLAATGAAAALAAGVAVLTLPPPGDDEAKPKLGLFTSLPIYWAESDSIAETLDPGGETHWVRAALEADNRLVPLDTLEGGDLKDLGRLIMAQPRPLAPAENVALDDWVRGGGRLLLFADPMLTEHSRFVLGDRRRPQDVVLLSPILRRWGLALEFEESQPDGERTVRVGDADLPVRLAGTLRRVEPGAPARCTLEGESRAARCAIGNGEALIVADAAILERERDPRSATGALAELIDAAFAR